jgi:hypothetical protein
MTLRVLFPCVRLLAFCLLAAPFAPGCEAPPSAREEPKPKAAAPQPEAKKTLLGPNVFLEVQGKRRRVLVSAEVCLQRGQLELFMCRRDSKEHESIVHADVDARDVHKALVAAGAEPGSPVQYVPKYAPPRGSTIKVGLEYEDKGKRVTHNAREWVRYSRTGKELDVDWVFAGSQLVDDPSDPTKPKFYLANGEGTLICVSNFETALLDLPINSSKDNADLSFEAFTDRIPPVGTKVVVTLEPVPDEKKGK